MPPPRSLPGLADDYTSQFFQGDVVTKLMDSTYRGKVLRCWAEEEGVLPPLPPGHVEHPLDRPLVRGEVGISNMLTGELAIVPETALTLYQREFIKGDVVKRSLVAVESAVVTDVKTEVQLEHVITRDRLKVWIPFEKLRAALHVEARDKVVYDEWIGTVEEVLEDGVCEANRDGTTYRIMSIGGTLEAGRFAADGMPPDTDFANMPGSVAARPNEDKIIDVRPIVLYISWNAINQQLPISEQDKHPQPPKFWQGEDIKKLTHIPGTHWQPPALGMTVRFEDESDEQKYGVKPTMHAKGTFRLATYKIVESRSRVSLRWQDGRETQDWAPELVPYHNIDDYETWPGEHLVWRGDVGERRAAVVQSFNPHHRTASLLFLDDSTISTVSVLELDPGGGGPGRPNYGVGFGQQVLLCKENGCELPEVPMLGEFGGVSPEDLTWRAEMDLRASEIARKRKKEIPLYLPEGQGKTVDWWGEVVDLMLDGQVKVRLASGDEKVVTIKEVQLLSDPGAELEMGGMGPEDEGMQEFMDGLYGDMEGEAMSEASWETMDEGEGEDDGGEEIVGGEGWEDEGEMTVDEIRIEEPQEEAGEVAKMQVDEEDDESSRDAEEVDPMITEPEWQERNDVEAGPSVPRPANGDLPAKPSLKDDDEWTAFEVLEEAPKDHHFYNEPRTEAASKAYNTRLQKEHRALNTSLPENILVRTYEDRTDLMRVLIVGPEGTPYADAPFVFDVYLHPTKFPYDPPLVHFHSHTNGKGRCNPNLYEDGKVCLSILGTWSGDKSESWNPTKSSLLQVFVSISGLVLVRSPYHCEPAFAKLEGTREGAVNSRLYSEKAYVLSRSFVRTALERPPTGLEKEIRYLYYNKGRLRVVLDHATRLIEKGEKGAADAGVGNDEEEMAEMWNRDAMGSLTVGAILTLKRTIAALEKILLDHNNSLDAGTA